VPGYQVRHISPQMIERLFRARVQVVHPDSLSPIATPDDLRQAQDDFKILVTARDVLVDPERRSYYDAAYRARRAGIYQPKPPLLSKRRLARLPLDQLLLAGTTLIVVVSALIYLAVRG
jgi:curved DNA-binding protein CbpA